MTIDGVVVMTAERRGARITIRPGCSDALVTRAVATLVAHLSSHSDRDVTVETIDGQPAGGSRYVDAFRAAGLKRGTTGLRFYQKL